MPNPTLRYPIPAQKASAEVTVLKSRFIATAAPAFTVAAARDFIEEIKAAFPDASHNVPAYQIGYGPAVTAHCSDDGEPAGTAGRPILAVLKGSGLGDIVLVVTRYFGGTLLGTGGLVRAYSDAARAVLEILPRAERVATCTVAITLPYSLFESIRRLIDDHSGEIQATAFAADVTVTARFVADALPAFEAALGALSRGALSATLVASDDATIMPLP